jgi:predicted HTH domain antitoxin
MKLEIDVPESAFSALRQGPQEFAASVRVIAAAKWYEMGSLSQERAAELAGQTRPHFLETLSKLNITPFQGIEDDIEALRE